MKKILLGLLIGIFLFNSCSSHLNIKNWQNAPTLHSGNLRSYPIEISPYGFQILSIPDLKTNLPTPSANWWQDAVVYEVYVRSFQDSDGDGHGDLNGLIQRLDYITNLGANALWMLPIFQSYWDGTPGRALGYEAEDYRKLNPYYGNMSVFSNLIRECHKRGIRVILDMVINHAATTLPAFQKSAQNDAKFKDWFIWTNASLSSLNKAGWQLPWGGGQADNVWHLNKKRGELFYATWGAEFNFRNSAVRQEFKNIADYWIERGVDGFRMDAIRYLMEDGPGKGQADAPSTFKYLKEYQAFLKKQNSKFMTVGEVWTGDNTVARYYLNGEGFDQCFSFDFHYRLKDALTSESALPLKGYLYSHKKAPLGFYSHFVDNHDVARLISSYRNNFDKAKLAAAILLTLPGTPYIYYGDEIGMLGQQTPMTWNASYKAGFSTNKPWIRPSFHKDPRNVEAQLNDTNSLWYIYQTLIQLRKNNPTLQTGNLIPIRTGNRQVLAYLRQGNKGSFLIVVNLGSKTQSLRLDLNKKIPENDISYPILKKGF